jgi:enoyl-CoA hydratase/carnithine racemase
VMPSKAALELMITGRRITAEEAHRLGVVSRVVGRTDLDDAVDLIVSNIAATSPVVMRLGRDAFYSVEGLDFAAALEHLHLGLTAVSSTEDAAEGVAAFLERRKPQWKGK